MTSANLPAGQLSYKVYFIASMFYSLRIVIISTSHDCVDIKYDSILPEFVTTLNLLVIQETTSRSNNNHASLLDEHIDYGANIQIKAE